MKSITIHGIDDNLNRRIQKKSREFGLIQNKTVKKLLENSLSDERSKRVEEFKDLFGTWSPEDEKKFAKQTKDLEKIDDEDWN